MANTAAWTSPSAASFHRTRPLVASNARIRPPWGPPMAANTWVPPNVTAKVLYRIHPLLVGKNAPTRLPVTASILARCGRLVPLMVLKSPPT